MNDIELSHCPQQEPPALGLPFSKTILAAKHYLVACHSIGIPVQCSRPTIQADGTLGARKALRISSN
jgi:hypothetical protein